jgi:hypothetical protein
LKDRLRQRAVDAVSNFLPRVEYQLTKRGYERRHALVSRPF